MTHATDPAIIERAAEQARARFYSSSSVASPWSRIADETKAVWIEVVRDALAVAIPEAVEQEREACAKIADAVSNGDYDGDPRCSEEIISTAIRGRTNAPEQKGDRHD